MNPGHATATLTRVAEHATADLARQDLTAGGYLLGVLATAGAISQVVTDLPALAQIGVGMAAVPMVLTVTAAARTLRARRGDAAHRPGAHPHAAFSSSPQALLDSYLDEEVTVALVAAEQARSLSRLVAARALCLERARRWLVATVVVAVAAGALGVLLDVVLRARG